MNVMPRGVLHALAWATLLVMGGIGAWSVVVLQHRDLWHLLLGDRPVMSVLVVGPVLGLATAWGAWWIISRPRLDNVRHTYSEMIGPWMARWTDRWFLSFCAGVGEELLFRGALQHWSGVPLTAFIFVAVHGYLDPRKLPLFIYGLYMTGAMMVFGLVAEAGGLLAPMIAHTLVDVVLLRRLRAEYAGRGSTP